MAVEKKSSIDSDLGTIGSAEELDAYGVWVKSEPQDMAASLAEAVGFSGNTMSYGADFDVGFDDIEVSGMDLDDIDSGTPVADLGDFQVSSFDDEEAEDEAPQGGMPIQIIMKIADELSSIRSELTTLKKEFADIRADGDSIERAGGFFSEAGGDEMDSIITSSGFSADEELAFDSLREVDAAALKKISEQNEASTADLDNAIDDEAPQAEEEEIEIDFDNLGINLDDYGVDEQDELSLAASDEMDIQLDEEFSAIDSLGDDEELRNLRLEGADPLIPAPDNTTYLEEYPFALGASVPEDPSPGEDSLDEAPLDLGDFAFESAELNEEISDDPFASLDLSDAIIDDSDLSAGLADLSLEEGDLGDLSLGMDDFELNADLNLQDDSLAQVIPEGFELDAEEEAASLDDELETFTDEDLSIAEVDDIEALGQLESSAVSMNKVPDGKTGIPANLESELKDVLSYMDHLLESLPEEKIEEFAKSEYFDTYKKIFKELGLV